MMKTIWRLGLLLAGLGVVVQTSGCGVLSKLSSNLEDTDSILATTLDTSGTSEDAAIEAVTALGRLEPKGKVVDLAAPPSTDSGARILELNAQEGDAVKAGDVIAILDSYAKSEALLEEAKRSVVTAQAQLEQVKAGAKTGEINAQTATIARLKAQIEGEISTQEARIARLQAELGNAMEEYDRHQTLFSEGAIADSLLDSSRTQLDSWQEQLREAKNVRDRIAAAGQEEIREAEAHLERIAEVRPVDIAVAQAEVDSAIAVVKRAEAELELAVVRSPLEGRILNLHVQPGEKVGEQGVATLGRIDQMYVIAEVYETDIDRVNVGQVATISSEYGGFSGELRGMVEQVGLQIHRNSLYDPNPSVQSDARVIEVKIRLDANDSNRVETLTNLQVRVRIKDIESAASSS